MNGIYFPVEEVVNNKTKDLFDKAYDKITSPENKLISFFKSRGGITDVASHIVERILPLSHLVPFVAYGGIVFSAAALIYSVYNEKIAFTDSLFLIHRNIPPKGKEEDPIYRAYDLQMWEIMSKCMGKISAEELDILASEDRIIDVYEAKKIGLVDIIIDDSYKNYKKYIKEKEGLVL